MTWAPSPDDGYAQQNQQAGKQAFVDAEADSRIYGSAEVQSPRSPYQLMAGVKSGRCPQPVHALGPNITAWRVEDVRALVQAGDPQQD